MNQEEMKKKGFGKRGTLVAVLLIAALGGFFILARGQRGSAPLSQENPTTAEGQRLLPVKVVPASEGTMEEYIRLSGDVQASSTIKVMPDTSGKLARLYVRPGDYVRKGQALAAVDPSRPGASFSLSPVSAPISGTVTNVLVEVGETVAPSMAVAAVGQLDELQVQVFVSEGYANRVTEGQKVLISLTALEGVTFPGVVAETAPVVNPQTRSMETLLAFDSESGRRASSYGIKAGMMAEVELILESRTATVKLPEKAVLTRGGKPFVYRLVEGSSETAQVEMVPVETGIQSDGVTEILAGVEPGDLIVITGTTRLADGSAVRVLETQAGLPAGGNLTGDSSETDDPASRS